MNGLVKQSIGVSSESNTPRTLVLSTIEDVYRVSKALSASAFVPKSYQGKEGDVKEGDVFAAITMGMEIGLPPMRALQSIAVVNGRPCLWGDAHLALVRQSGLLAEFKEYFEGVEGADNYTAVCHVLRKGDKEPTIERFSVRDAQIARLWKKEGTWSTHPKRMLKYKARAFALRDTFPDILMGLHSVEEMEGELIDVNPPPPKQSKTRNMHSPKVDAPVFEKTDAETGEVVFEKIVPQEDNNDFLAAMDAAEKVNQND